MEKDQILAGYGDVLQPKDLQEILHVGRNTVYKALADGAIASIRIGTQYRIPKRYLIDYIYPDGVRADSRKGEKENEVS